MCNKAFSDVHLLGIHSHQLHVWYRHHLQDLNILLCSSALILYYWHKILASHDWLNQLSLHILHYILTLFHMWISLFHFKASFLKNAGVTEADWIRACPSSERETQHKIMSFSSWSSLESWSGQEVVKCPSQNLVSSRFSLMQVQTVYRALADSTSMRTDPLAFIIIWVISWPSQKLQCCNTPEDRYFPLKLTT